MEFGTILSVVITGLVSVFTTLITASKNNALQDERIRNIQTSLTSLNDRVEKHNNYGLQLENLKTRVEALERKI